MMGEGLVAGLAKVAVVGGLMAAAAGGIYALSSTNGEDRGESVAQILETATSDGSATATETPISTPTGAVTATPTPTITATPTATTTIRHLPFTAPNGAMGITADVWVNAEPTTDTVKAFIGDTECASSAAVGSRDGGSSVVVIVPAEHERPGCGAIGATVRFEIDGTPARQTVAWEPGASVAMHFTIGPDFAIYYGDITPDNPPVGIWLEPLLNGTLCGRPYNGFLGHGPEYGFQILVYPDELRPGCGRAGAKVTLRVVHIAADTGARNVITELPGVEADWAPGDGSVTPFSDAPVVVNGVPVP